MEQTEQVRLLEARLAALIERARSANVHFQSGRATSAGRAISRYRGRSLALRMHMLGIYIEDLESDFRRLGW